MNTVARISLAIVCAAVLGIGSAFFILKQGWTGDPVRNGVWRTKLAAGSSSANIYTRAYIALEFLFALPKTETLYYIAFNDEQGQALNDRCVYRIEGKPLAARWWSITLYAQDGYLLANPLNRYSYSGTSIPMNSDGTFTIWAAPKEHAGNWLPSTNGGQVMLAARLYNPDPAVYEQPERVPLPHVERESCP